MTEYVLRRTATGVYKQGGECSEDYEQAGFTIREPGHRGKKEKSRRSEQDREADEFLASHAMSESAAAREAAEFAEQAKGLTPKQALDQLDGVNNRN